MSLDEMDEVKDKIKILVNRVGLKNGQISMKKAQETIGRDVFWQIPNDYKVMAEVRNNGVPLLEHAPRSAIAQSVAGLCKALCDGDVAAAATSASGGKWLSFWPGRGRSKGDA
jgi:pilus assembly protein CpaE